MTPERVFHGRIPVVGFGDVGSAPPAVAKVPSPWTVAVATSVLSAATGWMIEATAKRLRGRRR